MTPQRGRATAALVALALLAFLPALRSGFLWDDVSIYLLENPLLRAPDGLWRFWFTTQPVDYYPVTNTLFWLEWRLFGPHPFGYHLVQLGLHAATAVLLWRLLAALAVPGCWFAAALFAVHPVNVETVAWISQTKNTLSFGFELAALLAFLRFDAKRGSGGPRRLYVASCVFFVLAVLSKTSAVVVPIVLLGCIWWRRRRVGAADLRAVAPFAVIGLVLGLVAMAFQSRTSGAAEAMTEPFSTRLVAAGWILWFYLWKAIVPVGLALVYPRWKVDPSSPLAWMPLLLFLLVLGLAWWRRSGRGRPVLAALGGFLVHLLPVLGFVGIGFMAHTRVADHWQYAAIAWPLALLAGAALQAMRQRFSATRRAVFLALPLALLTVLSWRQTRLYVDEEVLWRDTLRKNRNAWVAHNNLGRVLVMRGRLPEAQHEFETALESTPRYPDALVNLANVLDDQGRTADAIVYYQRALQVSPPRADLHYNFGIALEKTGKLAEAAQEYRRVLELAPLDSEARQRLSAVQSRLGAPR